MMGNYKICPTCAFSFKANRRQYKYCRKECQPGFTRKSRKPRQRHCIGCSKLFHPGNRSQKFCMPSCRQKSDNTYFQTRFKVMARDNFQCIYCGHDSDECKLHVDHIIPRSKAGLDDMDNLVTSCEYCNLGKSDILLDARQLWHIKERLLARSQ